MSFSVISGHGSINQLTSNPPSMPSILIIGKNSFIGTNFIRFSQYKAIRVESLLDSAPQAIDFSGIDVALHLVAIVHVFNKLPLEEYYKVNRDLTLEVARCAKSAGVRHFIFMSTVKIYGDFVNGSSPWNEESIGDPSDNYGKSKYEAELELKKLSGKDFTISIIRMPVVYGDGVKGNILKLINLVNTLPFLPFAKIENRRNYVFVGNLAGYIDRIIELNAAGTFIAMDEESISTTSLVNYLSGYLGKRITLFRPPRFIIRIAEKIAPRLINSLYGSLELDNTATRLRLNFTPPYSIDQGLSLMIESYKKLHIK